MKKLFVLLFSSFVILHSPQAQTIPVRDTVTGRCDSYFYPSFWYDDCPRYQIADDTNRFCLRSINLYQPFLATEGYVENSRVLVEEHTTSLPITVKGVVAMVMADPMTDAVNSQYMPSINPGMAAEYLYILQGAGSPPPDEAYYLPHNMTLIDSVRWDTAMPRMLKIPKYNTAGTADEDFLYCYAYEAYFATPVTVDTFFYLMGSFHGNALKMADSTHLRYVNYPAIYAEIEAPVAGNCYNCTETTRQFVTDLPLTQLSLWSWHLHSFGRSVFGPFLPIVDH